MYTSEPFYFKYTWMYLFEFDPIKSSRFCFVNLGLLLLFLWAWGSLIFVLINFWSHQFCSLQIFVTLGNLGVLIFFQFELWGSLVSILWTLGVFCFVRLKFKVFNFLLVLGVLKKIGWNFAYGRWMGSLGFFLWTLGGFLLCFIFW